MDSLSELKCLITLDLDNEPSLKLQFTWLIGTLLSSIWTQRETRRVDIRQTRAELEAKCRLLRECKVKTWANAYVQTEALVSQFSQTGHLNYLMGVFRFEAELNN